MPSKCLRSEGLCVFKTLDKEQMRKKIHFHGHGTTSCPHQADPQVLTIDLKSELAHHRSPIQSIELRCCNAKVSPYILTFIHTHPRRPLHKH
eukprot:TCALIF_06608-PA protein Name:"Protein of unknown function" AED:0.68 eAED:0.84 QI:0/0/0/1/0/0.5/2/0/91